MRNRRIETGLGIGFAVAWILGVLFSLALTVGAVIVAIHFIHKFW